MKKTFVADFETTTCGNDCRVWAYCLCDIENVNEKIIGNNLDDFMSFCAHKRENFRIFLHKLEFDGQFIIAWLFKNGFIHTTEQSERRSKTFNTLIDNKGIWYQIEVIFERKGRTINKVTFQNSYNLIPLSVDKISKAFKLPISKLDLDYDTEREIGHELTEHEKEYISNDAEIVARAIKHFFDNGLDKMTIGSCALAEYKKTIGEKKFKIFFPPFDYDKDIRQAYKGGYTYLEPEFEEKTIGEGLVLDINSTHPYTLYKSALPYGTPIFFRGKYEYDEYYPIYIQMIRCQFELKEGYLPTVQIRYSPDFNITEYIKSSNGVEVVLCLTNVDLELFLEHYNVYNIEYFSGWKFKSAEGGLFDDYIEYWYGKKNQSKEEENWGMYEISKRMLVALYGKFGTLPVAKNKWPYMDKDGTVNFKDSYAKDIDGVYLPVAIFVTAHSRKRIIDAFQKIKDNYNAGISKAKAIYTDTDSLHIELNGESIETFLENCGLEIDEFELGKFKIENVFRKARYLRQKCYIMDAKKPGDQDYKMKVTVAGMPDACHEYVTFKNFKYGTNYKGRMDRVRVPGGVILNSVDYTLQKV